jgi:hypothetical protein
VGLSLRDRGLTRSPHKASPSSRADSLGALGAARGGLRDQHGDPVLFGGAGKGGSRIHSAALAHTLRARPRECYTRANLGLAISTVACE